MQTVEIVFTLPQDLVSLAQEAGLLTNTRLANWIEQELDRSHEASFGVDQSLEILRRENEVFARLQAELRVAYPNEFVAIHNGQVMDHDLNRRALFARVSSTIGLTPFLLKHVETNARQEFTFRSPRLTRGKQ